MVEAVQTGPVPDQERICPPVPWEVVERAPEPFPTRSAPACMLLQPVPPFGTPRIPVMVARVVDDTHCMPEPVDWRTWPAVPGALAPAKRAPVKVMAVEEA